MNLLSGIGVAAALGVSGYDLATALNTNYQNNYTAPVLITYPSDLPKNQKVAAIIFNFYKYDRPSILNAPNLISQGSIALPLPSELNDILSENYERDRPGAVVGGIMESLAGKNNSVTKAYNSINSALTGAVGTGVSNLVSDFGGQDLVNRILSMGGIVQNPFLSMLFNSPNFKEYTFSWTFNPESANDSATLNFILKKLRYHTMPGIASGISGSLLNYPDMCVPVILPSGYMFDFKQCVISGIGISYAPGDTPAFFDSTMAPTSIKLTISLIEIEYWVKSDMTNFQAPGGLKSLTQDQQIINTTVGKSN